MNKIREFGPCLDTNERNLEVLSTILCDFFKRVKRAPVIPLINEVRGENSSK